MDVVGTAVASPRERRADGTPDWVLRGVSFVVRPGERVAFVGATGAGKSSIVNLISRFYEFQTGRITIDGVDIRDIPVDVLRSRIILRHLDEQDPSWVASLIYIYLSRGLACGVKTVVKRKGRAQPHDKTRAPPPQNPTARR